MSSKFVGYRVIAECAVHTDSAGYREIIEHSSLDDCKVGAWHMATQSTQRATGGMLCNWVIAQVAIAGEIGQIHWRTIEVINLGGYGKRVVSSVTELGGIAFDLESIADHPQPIEPSLEISIDEQLKIWDANTPRFNQFPLRNQSAIYALGDVSDNGSTLPGALIVFNSRRKTVRAYSNSWRNQTRIWGMLGNSINTFGKIGDSAAFVLMLGDDSAPNGAPMPPDLGRVRLAGGKSIYFAGGVAMLIPATPRNSDQIDWMNSIDDTLAVNCIDIDLWGYGLKIGGDFPAEISEYRGDGLDWLGRFADGLRADVGMETSANCDIPSAPGISSQIRDCFSAIYPTLADSAIIEWRNGAAGDQWYLTVHPRHDWEAPIELVYIEGIGLEWLANYLQPIPTPDDLSEYARICAEINLDQIPYDGSIEYPIAAQWQPSPRQRVELVHQLAFYAEAIEQSRLSGDMDKEEILSCFYVAMESIVTL